MKRTRTCILCGPWTKKLRCAISYSAAFCHPTTAFWAFVWCRFPAPPAIHAGVLAGAAFREDQKHCAPCGHLGEMGVIWYERLGFAFSPALREGPSQASRVASTGMLERTWYMRTRRQLDECHGSLARGVIVASGSVSRDLAVVPVR